MNELLVVVPVKKYFLKSSILIFLFLEATNSLTSTIGTNADAVIVVYSGKSDILVGI